MASIDEVKMYARKYEGLYKSVIKEISESHVEIQSLYDPYQSWPFSSDPGIYCFYDDKHALYYVGKTSANGTLGNRLSDYFKTKEHVFKKDWEVIPSYVSCIAVNKSWEAPSLEEYLIFHLRPPKNTIGNRE